mmetsp:Transcript_23240/g.33196  ORF Transcript_23240/g.33196 Transcript_23240/m.33196 type:complete len:116 (+) Transcript_23240:136-483(+)
MNSRSDIRHYADCGEGPWIIPADNIYQLDKSKTELTEEDKEEIWMKCIHLRNAYVTALEELNRISTWAECCEKTASRVEDVLGSWLGYETISRTIEEWNRIFRVNHQFPISNHDD